jgi:hypothetical protein
MSQEDNMEHRSSIRQQKQYQIVQAKEGYACFRVQLPGKGKEEAVKDQTAAEGCHCPRGFDEEDTCHVLAVSECQILHLLVFL